MHVSVASISQLAKDFNCVTFFTGTRAYVLKPGAVASIKNDDIMITAAQKNGLYLVQTSKFVEAVMENSKKVDRDD
jgi:hypothetical protein